MSVSLLSFETNEKNLEILFCEKTKNFPFEMVQNSKEIIIGHQKAQDTSNRVNFESCCSKTIPLIRAQYEQCQCETEFPRPQCVDACGQMMSETKLFLIHVEIVTIEHTTDSNTVRNAYPRHCVLFRISERDGNSRLSLPLSTLSHSVVKTNSQRIVVNDNKLTQTRIHTLLFVCVCVLCFCNPYNIYTHSSHICLTAQPYTRENVPNESIILSM